MARTKNPPIVHIPFLRPVTRITNPQAQTEKTQPKLPSSSENIPNPKANNNKNNNEKWILPGSSSTHSVGQETPAPGGVTQCPRCKVNFSNMAIPDVRDHVLSCNRPTTSGSASDESELSDPPDSPKASADRNNVNQDGESDSKDLLGRDVIRGFQKSDFDDLPQAYLEDEEDSHSPGDETAPAIKFPKHRNPSDILASLDGMENMSTAELHRRAANIANILDTIQEEWMSLEKETVKASAGDGVPNPRNPRALRERIMYQDRLEADVYGYAHNPHPTLIGRQDPIAQRQSATGDGDTKSRLRKQTLKMKATETDNWNPIQEAFDESGLGRPVRNRHTPSRYESESREQTPIACKKPRGRGRGNRRVDELRSEHVGGRVPSPLALASMSDPEQQLSMKDRALASTEADEEATGVNTRPPSSSSSQSQEVEGPSAPGKKHRREEDTGKEKPTKKKQRTKANSTEEAKAGKKKTRAKQMTIVDGVARSKQSLMMEERWAAYKANPRGPRIGRVRNSQSGEKDTASDSRSSRKRSLDETNAPAEAACGGGKKRKLAKDNHPAEGNVAEKSEQAPVKGKRGGRREGSGRKPAKASANKPKKRSRASAERSEAVEGHSDDNDDRATKMPVMVGDQEPSEPSSNSTRASARTRKPSVAKQEADESISNAKKSKGTWGGKREKGKHSDGSSIAKAISRAPKHLREESLASNAYGTEGNTDQSQNEEQEGAEEEDDDGSPVSQKKPARSRKNSSKGSSVADDYPDLPLYVRGKPSEAYLALPKHLKMKAVSRARWANGGMGHMFGKKGSNQDGQPKLRNGDNSSPTSVSGGSTSVPASTRRAKSLFRNMGHDGADDGDMEFPVTAATTLKRKISEYEEFQALTSPKLHSEGLAKRGPRGAALRASHSFIEPTSSEFEDEDDEGEADDARRAGHKNINGVKEKNDAPKEKEKMSRKGVGGQPPRAVMPPIQMDVADSGRIASFSRSGSSSGKVLTTYEEFQALSAPGSPLVLGKRIRKSVPKMGSGVVTPTTTEDDYGFDD